MEETYNMTQKELFRVTIIQQLCEKLVTQVKAAEILKISDRQVRNLLKVYKNEGPKGLISKKRGKKSNRAYSQEIESRVVSHIKENYEDFGPTLAHEKLSENDGIKISVETVRKYMIKHNLYVPRKKQAKVYRSRARRENFGELIQTDASIHDWFEGRGDKCALIACIDDATSIVTSLHFHKSECLEGYFEAIDAHLKRYGRPLAVYSDRHSIFGGSKRIKNAQLVRALKELDIESILAGTPQAKGRVERVFKTLQDRLIKEMRLLGISTMEEANIFLEKYIEVHNRKFSKEPRGQIDTHRPLDCSHDLQYILANREVRTVSNNLSISFYNKTINIQEPKMINRLKGKQVNVIERKDGSIEIYYRGELLKIAFAMDTVDEKKVLDFKDKMLWKPMPKKPGKHHPWRRYTPPQKRRNVI